MCSGRLNTLYRFRSSTPHMNKDLLSQGCSADRCHTLHIMNHLCKLGMSYHILYKVDHWYCHHNIHSSMHRLCLTGFYAWNLNNWYIHSHHINDSDRDKQHSSLMNHHHRSTNRSHMNSEHRSGHPHYMMYSSWAIWSKWHIYKSMTSMYLLSSSRK